MVSVVPLFLALLGGLAYWQLSVWRTHRALDAASTRLADARLLDLTGQLAQALDLDQVPVFIHETPAINGLAAPDGRIFLTRGFYDRYRAGKVTADELASVIAHELGHVALGHSRRRMILFALQNATRGGLIAVLARLLPGFAPLVAGFVMDLVVSGMSRQDEHEADAYASALLVKAGLGLGAQISLFEKLEHLSGARGTRAPVWLMSHPRTRDRIARIRQRQTRWQA